MSPTTSTPRGMYFEEFEIGQSFVTAGRTVTESDIVTFAGLSGDFNQIHTDAEYVKTHPVGQRVAHGLLVMSIASGLGAQTGVLEGTVLVFREISHWKFVKPVFIGDTIRVEMNVIQTKALRRIGGGSVSIELVVNNQDDEMVMKGTWVLLMASRPD